MQGVEKLTLVLVVDTTVAVFILGGWSLRFMLNVPPLLIFTPGPNTTPILYPLSYLWCIAYGVPTQVDGNRLVEPGHTIRTAPDAPLFVPPPPPPPPYAPPLPP